MNRIRLESGSQPIPGWKLTELRGKGGFAEVWEAVSPAGERIAIKFMAGRSASASVKEMRIIQTIQQLRHPGLLRMDRIWSIPEYIVIAMELADGSLLDVLEAHQTEFHTQMAPEVVIHYLGPVAAGLDFLNCHQHSFEGRIVGFQHADVKPSNLLIVGNQTKIADFGLCRPTVAAVNTQQGQCGTPDFAAPEVHRGVLADTSDQYSLAVTYFHLRTGQFPFPAQMAGFKRENSYQRPAPNLAGVSREESRVLERALELEPSLRWPNCQALMSSLSDACSIIHHTPLPHSRLGTLLV